MAFNVANNVCICFVLYTLSDIDYGDTVCSKKSIQSSHAFIITYKNRYQLYIKIELG